MTDVYIDPRFYEAVRTHILVNLLSDSRDFPLILGIFGPPGEGKTYQVEKICADLGLVQHLLSPGELESENAGAPGQLLRRQYLEAASESSRGRPGLLVVNDVDTILGNWGSLVQYTVNRQVVYAQLMALCDYPTNVAGHECRRTPIILTGNDPSILYGPLLRPGRMRIVAWEPDALLRAKMVASLFPLLTEVELKELTSTYPAEPTSFWADVRATLLEEKFREVVDHISGHELRRILADGSRIRIESPDYAIGDVARQAKELSSVAPLYKSYLPSSSKHLE